MPTREYTLANGVLAASAGTILAGTSLPPNLNGYCLAANFQNTAATSETVVITMQVAGGTARRVARVILATNESLQINGLQMQPDDTLLGTTTNASAVDYVIMAGSAGPLSITTLDANGAAKTSNGTTAGFVVGDDGLGAYGTDSEFRFSFDTTDANANEFLLQMPAGGAVNVPVLAIGQSIESVDLGLYNGVVDPRIAIFGVGAVTTAPVLEFRKARGTIAAPTVCTTGDDLGTLDFYGAVANGEYVRSASIRADIAGTIATTRGPGTLTFLTATDAAPSVMTTALTISAAQLVTCAAGLTVNGAITTLNGVRTAALTTAVAITGATALVLADSGGIFTVAQSSAYDIDLPSPTTGAGSRYLFQLVAPGAFNVTVTVLGGAATFEGIIVNDVTSVIPATGATLTFASGVSALGDYIEAISTATGKYFIRAVTQAAGGITIA